MQINTSLHATNNRVEDGFLLTASSRDRGGRASAEFWVMTENGPHHLIVSDQKVVSFVPTESEATTSEAIRPLGSAVSLQGLNLKCFDQRLVSGVYADSISDHYTAQDQIRHRGVEVFESDIRLHERYLMERFAFGSISFTGKFVRMGGYTQVTDCKVKSSRFRPSPKVLSLDIECAMDGQLFSVGLASRDPESSVNEVLMIGAPEDSADILVRWVKDEPELLRALVSRINAIDPDLIVGWNLVHFDIRILLQRCQVHGIAFAVGRDGSKATWRDMRGEPGKGYVTIKGRLAIDGIEALKSATWSFPSFSLETVARTLLNRGKKVEQDVDDRVAEIVHNFHHNKTGLAAYNLEDCLLVLDVFEHTEIIDFLILRSQLTGLELDRAGGSVAAFTNLYLPRLHRAGYVAPNLPEGGGLASPGGYVMDSEPGLYKNVLVLDFKSLYPSIIKTFKIDPVGLIEGLENPDTAIAGFRGAMFHREKHFLPEIISNLWRERDEAKAKNDAARSQAIKILMNSFYGVLGSGGCRFYDPRLASSITLRGHEIMQTTRKWIESMGYDVIYGDTDSTFVSLDDGFSVSKCREVGREIAAAVNENWKQKILNEYQIDSELEIEFETCFTRFLMPTIRGSEAGSKKRYAGLLAGDNGIDDKIIFKGLENVRTDWTALAKEFQAALFDMVFHDQDPSELVRETVEETLAGRCNEKLVYRKQLRRQLDAYVKNVPPHVRAARIADQFHASEGRAKRYQNKGWIQYVITLNGPQPLECITSDIDYEHYIVKQLKPVADAILPFVGLEFDSLASAQAVLF
ncbi:MAG: DNA polymerase II [Acidiferrobacterales bacterium]|nr:DNA polymerase II [Acidiferrobacterales bacterium]